MPHDEMAELRDEVAALRIALTGMQEFMLRASQHECDRRPTCACCGVKCSPRLSHRLAPFAGVVCQTCVDQPAGESFLIATRSNLAGEVKCPPS